VHCIGVHRFFKLTHETTKSKSVTLSAHSLKPFVFRRSDSHTSSGKPFSNPPYTEACWGATISLEHLRNLIYLRSSNLRFEEMLYRSLQFQPRSRPIVRESAEEWSGDRGWN